LLPSSILVTSIRYLHSTRFLTGDDDVRLKQGSTINVTVDPGFKDKCTAETLYMDYENLPKVIPVGGIM